MASVVQSPCAHESGAEAQCRHLLPILETAGDEALVLALVELCRARQSLLGAVVAALSAVAAASTASPDDAGSQDAERDAEGEEAASGCAGALGSTGTSTRTSWASESSEGATDVRCSSCDASSECGSHHQEHGEKVLDFKPVQGVLFPVFYNHDEIDRLRDRWESRRGDVILTAPWPLRGLKRILTAIVEGRVDDPYAQGFMDKPRTMEMYASKIGSDAFGDMWSGYGNRRLLETLALPHEVPFAWPPSEDDILAGRAPKIVVIIADPRYALALMWEMLSSCCKLNLPMRKDANPVLADFVEALVENHFSFFSDPFKHSMAWAQEAIKWPDHVKVLRLERFASLDPREVSAACSEFAEIVGVKDPEMAAMRLMTAVARRPAWAAESLAKDAFPDPEAIRGGSLVELVGPRIQDFEASLSSLAFDTKAVYRQILFRMMDNPILADVAGRAVHGVSTVPPLKEFSPFKGEAAHAAGTCRMCVFALRGACRNSAEMCPFCHLPGHSPPKRPSKHKREMNKRTAAQARCRTPSLDGLSS